MERLLRFLVPLAAVLTACAHTDPRVGQEPHPGDLVLVSQNVHYYAPDRDDTDWVHRRYALTAALEDLQADIVLFQEMETFQGREESSVNLQRDWVLETVPGYRAGADAPDAAGFPITQPIFYKTARFELLDQGYFFFSDTPDVAYSRTWEGHYPSFTSWVLLKERDGDRRLYVYNTHLEAFAGITLALGTRLLRDRIAHRSDPGVPVVLGGDFNMLGQDGNLAALGEAGLVRAPADAATFHFQRGWHLYPAIDHFWAAGGLVWRYGGAVQRTWAGTWPSDHHPVLAVYHWGRP